jgi:hypothetical protein
MRVLPKSAQPARPNSTQWTGPYPKRKYPGVVRSTYSAWDLSPSVQGISVRVVRKLLAGIVDTPVMARHTVLVSGRVE